MNKFGNGIFKKAVFLGIFVLFLCFLLSTGKSSALTLKSAFLFGGSFYDIGQSIKADSSGNIYMVGNTYSNDLPTTAGSHRPLKGTNTSQDLYIVKFNSSNQIVYCTYFGGTGEETSIGLAVNSSGNVFITGRTYSVDMPTTREAGSTAYLNSTFNLSGLYDAFIAEFNSTGGLVYSTYFGGDVDDVGHSLAIDSQNNLYVAGSTSSTDFPTTEGAYQTSKKPDSGVINSDMFISKFNSSGVLVYSTYLGGGADDIAKSLAVDSFGSVYIGGYSDSSDITTKNAYKSTYSGDYDIILSKLDLNGAGVADLDYLTYMGGIGIDYIVALAIDSSSKVYITGIAGSNTTDFTKGSYSSTFKGGPVDAYIAKFDTSASGAGSLIYSAYLAGNDVDVAPGIAVDGSNNIYLTGYTSSTDFPTQNALYSSYSGAAVDAFVTKFNDAGNVLTLGYSTYFGGTGIDYGNCVALDSSGNIYVAGQTSSTNFPTTEGAGLGTTSYKAFILKFGVAPPAPIGFTITPESTASLRYSWADNSNNETGFRILDGSNNVKLSVVANTTTTIETGLATNTAYTRKVQAYNAEGASTSDSASKYTSIEAIIGATFEGATSTSITIHASGEPSNLSSGGSGILFTNVTTGAHSGTDADPYIKTNTWTSTGLTANTVYTFSIKTINGEGVQTASYTTAETTSSIKEIELFEAFVNNLVSSGQEIEFKLITNEDVNSLNVKFYAGETSRNQVLNLILNSWTNVSTSLGLKPQVSKLGDRYGWRAVFAGITQEGTYSITGEVTDVKGNLYKLPAGIITVRVMNATQPDILGSPLFYPNPFDPSKGSMKISYTLVKNSDITIYVSDSIGELMWKNNFASGTTGGDIGYNEVLWSGINNFGSMIGNGTYLIRIFESGSKRLLGKSNVLVINGR